MKPKILVISDYRGFHTARPEAEIFIGLVRRGYEVHVMTYAEAEYAAISQEAGVKVIAFHPKRKNDAAEIAFIRQALIDEKYDVLHLFNSVAIVNGIAAAKHLPVKVILYRGYSGNVHWYDPTAYLKYLHPRVDKIVCNSIGVKQMFDNQFFFDKNKAIVINKGHRLEWYADVQPTDIRRELGIAQNALLLINVANNRHMKGIPYLLGAMADLPLPLDVHLLLVGRDMDTKQNKKILANCPRPERVHFLGFRKDALNLVAASDAFVSSSIKGESITKSIIEAMALGVAPVITNIAGNVELVEHEHNGLVVARKDARQLKEAILRLYNDRSLCRTFGERSKQRIVSHLHTDKTIEGYQAMYREMGF